MASTREEDKPWKTDLARKSVQRRELVARELEELVKRAPSFEEALKQAVDMMKRKFARFTGVTAYVADGENLVILASLERPQAPDRVRTDEGALAGAAHGERPTVVSDLSGSEPWAALGLTKGSALVAPVRTDAGLWALLEIWSDFRDAFTPHDVRLVERVASALAKKTPAA